MNPLSFSPKYRLRSIKQGYGPGANPVRPALAAAAVRLLESALPGHWLLRAVAGRPYGTDCLLEIVDEQGPLDGQGAWLQLHVLPCIPWDTAGRYETGAVQTVPSCDRRMNSGPLFIVLADLCTNELFFLCSDAYLQQHFRTYLRDGYLPYCFDRQEDRFTLKQGALQMGLHLEQQAAVRQLENLLTLFLISLDELPAGAAPRYPVVEQLRDITLLLRDTLAYWSFTNPTMYYYLHSLTQHALCRFGMNHLAG